MKIKTNIPKLDELLGGGLEAYKSILIYSTPGIESLQFAQHLFYNRIKQGDRGVYFVNNKKPEVVRYELKEYDWNLENYEKKGLFYFFDCYSGLSGLKSEEKFFVKNPNDINEIKKIFFKSVEEMKNNKIVILFDSLSTLIDLCKPDQVVECLKDCFSRLSKLKVTPIFLFTEWPYDKTILQKIKGLFDCIINLKAIERKVIFRNYYSISKANWLKSISKKDIPFKIIKPGGVKAYIPKILVTGPYNAGKSSFVHSASTRAVSVDRIGTTVALDHGHVDYKDFAVDLWGTPGQERFDPILEQLGGESLGVIVIVDATDPKSFARAKDMVEKTKTTGLPSIIVANKANLQGALSIKEIEKKMKLPREIAVIPVVAADLKKVSKGKPCKLKQKDVNKVLGKLFEEVV